MKRSRLVPVIATAAVVAAGSGYAASLPQQNPAKVPQGELALESKISTAFSLQLAGFPRRSFPQGAQITVEHDQFPAQGKSGSNSGWHSHAGPVFVEVVRGTLTLYEANDPKCAGTRYPAGTGFLEPGHGNVHDARNETNKPVDIYAVYILPPGSGDAGLYQPRPLHSNKACPFAS